MRNLLISKTIQTLDAWKKKIIKAYICMKKRSSKESWEGSILMKKLTFPISMASQEKAPSKYQKEKKKLWRS